MSRSASLPGADAPRRAYVKPAEPMTEAQARRHVEKLKEFYWNLVSFLVVMPVLIGINVVTYSDFLWFFFPLIGWGFGLLGHAAEVFGVPGLGRWEERKMQELMGRDDADAAAERLRALVSEAVGEEEARQRRAQDVGTERLVRRIEHLEAIVTSRDWDLVEADYRQAAEGAAFGEGAALEEGAAPRRLDLDALPEPPEAPGPEGGQGASHRDDEQRAAYLARRVY